MLLFSDKTTVFKLCLKIEDITVEHLFHSITATTQLPVLFCKAQLTILLQ